MGLPRCLSTISQIGTEGGATHQRISLAVVPLPKCWMRYSQFAMQIIMVCMRSKNLGGADVSHSQPSLRRGIRELRAQRTILL